MVEIGNQFIKYSYLKFLVDLSISICIFHQQLISIFWKSELKFKIDWTLSILEPIYEISKKKI